MEISSDKRYPIILEAINTLNKNAGTCTCRCAWRYVTLEVFTKQFPQCVFFLLSNLLYGMFDNYNWPKYCEGIGERKIRPDLNYKNFKTAGLHVPTIRVAPVINFVTWFLSEREGNWQFFAIGQLQLIHLSVFQNSLKLCQSQSAHRQQFCDAVCYAQWFTQSTDSDKGRDSISLNLLRLMEIFFKTNLAVIKLQPSHPLQMIATYCQPAKITQTHAIATMWRMRATNRHHILFIQWCMFFKTQSNWLNLRRTRTSST